MIELHGVTIDLENESYKSDGKAVYTKDGKSLIRYYGNDIIVNLNEGLECINEYAFRNKSNITNIVLPKTLKELQPYCFYHCSKFKEISLGKSVNKLVNTVFSSSYLVNITIDDENQNYSIINGALYNKDGTIFVSPLKRVETITTYSIPEGVKKIAEYAFYSQRKMTSVTLPSTLEKIDRYAFAVCTSLPKIEIPSSVTTINTSCFADCGVNLKEIVIHKPKGSIANSPWGCEYGDRAIKWDN